jgi:hypothetical protein
MTELEKYKKALYLVCEELRLEGGITACEFADCGCGRIDPSSGMCTRPEVEWDQCLPEYYLKKALAE